MGHVDQLYILHQKAKIGELPITDMDMTRFNISLEQSVEMVLWALEHSLGGEVFVPKIPSYRIPDLAEAIGPQCKTIVGLEQAKNYTKK